ncbi:MAG TPA: hypothetical protein V6D14_35500 [Coleofasciculaceae cyanobacterium]|jgi:hypothetical protein
MAKRRNLKKEKAQRNQAYARKFRKRKNTGRFSKNRRYNRPPMDENQEEDDGDRDQGGDRRVSAM